MSAQEAQQNTETSLEPNALSVNWRESNRPVQGRKDVNIRRLGLAVVLALACSMMFVPQALAASRSRDLQSRNTQGSAATAGSQTVLIAVDATPQSTCEETLQINIGWRTTPPPGAPPLVPTTLKIPCAAGTVMKTAAVALAQALAQHEAYVLMPANPKAPTAAERAAIHALLDAKRHSVASGQSATIQPLTACGATSWGTLQWTADSQGFYSRIHWYKYPNCTQVLLDYAELNVGSMFSFQQWYWDSDVYNNTMWSVGTIALQQYASYHYYPNRTDSANQWYRQVLDEYVNGYFSSIWDSYIAVCN